MILCGNCHRPYVCQTYNAGINRRINEAKIYRHRKKAGHCSNRQIRAPELEQQVWEVIVELLRSPDQLREGYEASLEQQKSTRSHQISLLQNMRMRLAKLDDSKDALNAAYVDPDIQLTKHEYIKQNSRIDDEMQHLVENIESVERELASIPTPAELETLEAFAAEINRKLDMVEPTEEEKHKILELLHVKVIAELDGEIRLEGWFSSPEASDEEVRGAVTSEGLLDQGW